jgi:hypothetical protein
MNVISEISGFAHNAKYEDHTIHKYGDFVFRKSRSKNMDKLWAYFYENDSYPEYYLGIAKKVAICKCLITGKEEWFNVDRFLYNEIPIKNSTVTVKVHVKDKIYTRDFIFMGWVKTSVHEWRMRKGSTLQLEQKFVDGLLPQDKRYLKLTM